MADESVADVIAGLLYCALKPEALTEDGFRQGLDVYNRVKSTEDGGDFRHDFVSKIDTGKSTQDAVQNGPKPGGIADQRRAVVRRLMESRHSSQEIADAAGLTVEDLRAFLRGGAKPLMAEVRALNVALDDLEGKE